MVRTLFLHLHWVLYPLWSNRMTLYLNRFRRKPAISMFDWPFTPFHNSSPSIATDVSSVLQISLEFLHLTFSEVTNNKGVNLSTWSWKDHVVSGLILSTCALNSCSLSLAFTFTFKPAERIKSFAHYAKGTSIENIECFYSLDFKFF